MVVRITMKEYYGLSELCACGRLRSILGQAMIELASASTHTKLRALEEACWKYTDNAMPYFPNESND